MRKHPTWMPILALAYLTVAVLAAGCDQPVQVAVLAGTITDALTGNPVSGARVVSGSKDAITNSDGQYVLQNLQPGTRPITVNAGGYATFSTVAVASGGLQQLDIKLAPESAPKNRFRDIDRLIASHQYVLATDRLEAMLKSDWRDLDVLARLATVIAATVKRPLDGVGKGDQNPKTYLGKWGIDDLHDPYAQYFIGKLYGEWALTQAVNTPVLDRLAHKYDPYANTHVANESVNAYLLALAGLDNYTVRFELGQMCHWYSTSCYPGYVNNTSYFWMSGAEHRKLQRHAEEHLKKAIEFDPTAAEAYAELAELYVDIMDYSSANEALRAGMQAVGADTMAPDSEIILAGALAHVAMQESQWEQALKYSLRCVELQPKEPLFRAYAGRCYIGLGEKYEAFDSLTRAKDLGLDLRFYLAMLDSLTRTLR